MFHVKHWFFLKYYFSFWICFMLQFSTNFIFLLMFHVEHYLFFYYLFYICITFFYILLFIILFMNLYIVYLYFSYLIRCFTWNFFSFISFKFIFLYILQFYIFYQVLYSILFFLLMPMFHVKHWLYVFNLDTFFNFFIFTWISIIFFHIFNNFLMFHVKH